MKRLRHILGLSILLLVMSAVQSRAQTSVRNTTLAAAITDPSATSITLTATTGMAVNDIIFSPGWPFEGMRVMSIGTGGVVRVTRGVFGRAMTHMNAKRVWYGPPGSAGPLAGGFQPLAPNVSETCTRASLATTPWIDTTTGTVWTCGDIGEAYANRWQGTVDTKLFFDSVGNLAKP